MRTSLWHRLSHQFGFDNPNKVNKNRNPHLDKGQIEQYLRDYLGVSNVLWLGDGIIGDDTDGHIDDLARFVNARTVVTVVEEAMALVLTVSVAVVAPAVTVILEGTLAAAVLLLESATCAPPAGAGPLRVTVPVDEFSPVTLVGFSESEERATDAGAEKDSSKSRIAGLGSFCETATNFEGEII